MIPDELIKLQLELEESMTQRGIDKYFRSVYKSREKMTEDRTSYGQTIVAGRLITYALAIEGWLAECGSGRPGVHRSTAYQKLKGTDPKLIAFLSLRAVMNGISSRRTLQDVATTIGGFVEDELRFAEVREEEKKHYDYIVEEAKKRTAYHYKRVYAVRKSEKLLDWKRWTRIERLHVGTKMLELCMNSIGLVELSSANEKSIKYVQATPETLSWIERKNDAVSVLRPVYEPMIVPPRNWTDPFDGGYLSSNIKPLKLVKTKSRGYIQELASMDMPIVYEAINTIQQTPWAINKNVLEVMTHLFEMNNTIAGLPSGAEVQLPVKPVGIENDDKLKLEYRIAAAKAYADHNSRVSKRISFNISLDIATRYKDFDKIYFPYQLDFRGRIYAVPQLNPQGADYQKALLMFAEGKALGEEGWKWLAIHGANCAGYDKVSLEDRVHWVLENEDEILSIANDPYGNRSWCGSVGGVEVDKPWQFLAFCYEWAGYNELGEDYVSRIPVALDGSCSGLQHFSAMLKDEIGGSAVNLIPSEKPQDVYGLVAQKVIEQVKHDLEHGTEDELKHTETGVAYVMEGTKTLADQWLKFGINRKVTKRSVMTLAYGSKEYGFKEQLMSDILYPSKKKATKPDGTVDVELFPFNRDGYGAAIYMAKQIWIAVKKTLVKASEAMKWLQGAASLLAGEDLPVRWTTPVGFPVMQSYYDVRKRQIKTALNGRIDLIMAEELDTLDRRRQSNGIAPNFIHSCDASHMMLTVVRAAQVGIKNFAVIHDSFGTLAGDTEELFYTVRESFVELYNTLDVLGNFKDEITHQLSEKSKGKLEELPSSGNLELSRVVESKYCFA